MTVPDFDYRAKAEATLAVPIAERIAAIRARKAEERARAKVNAERRSAAWDADPDSGLPADAVFATAKSRLS